VTGPRTVLYVQQFGDGGSVTSLLDLVRGLDRSRYRPVVAFRTTNPFVAEFEALGARVVCLFDDAPAMVAPSSTLGRRTNDGSRSGSLRREVRRWVRRDLPAYRRLREIARTERPAIIHANNEVRTNRDALLTAVRLRIPVVVHMRWLYDQPHGDLTVPTDRLLAKIASRFFFISRAAAKAYDPLHIPERKRIVVDNPFAVDDYRAEPSSVLADELGVGGAGPVLVHIGRIIPWKGQDVLVRALPTILEHEPRARVVFVGAATDAKGDAFDAELRELVADLGVTDHVRFVGARRDIADVLALATVVVHCSTTPEPFGRVVVEAMAAQRPVVAARAGGVPEIVTDGRTGRLVGPSDPIDLARAVIELLSDPPGADAMAARARAEVEQRFSIEAHSRVVQAAYDEVLSARRGPRRS